MKIASGPTLITQKINVKQNCSKNMKLPEILIRDRHLKNKREGRYPPGPPYSVPLQMDKIPNWTKFRFGQNPELDKIQNGQNPE